MGGRGKEAGQRGKEREEEQGEGGRRGRRGRRAKWKNKKRPEIIKFQIKASGMHDNK